jgi:hypothetical protein
VCLRHFVPLFVAPVVALSVTVASAADVSLRARSFSLFFTICAPRFWSNGTWCGLRVNATIPIVSGGDTVTQRTFGKSPYGWRCWSHYSSCEGFDVTRDVGDCGSQLAVFQS